MPSRPAALRPLAIVLAVACLAASPGCARGDAGGGDSASGTSGARAATQTPMAGATDSATLATPRGPTPVRGDSAPGAVDVIAEPLQWTADAVLARMSAAGLAVVPRGAAPPLAAGPAGLRVSVANGAAEVLAYIFGDPDAVTNATRGLDLARLGTGGRPATLVVDNNLGAVVITGDEKLRERIRFALVARRGEGR